MIRPTFNARQCLKVRVAVAALLVVPFIVASSLRSFGYFADDLYWLQEDLGGDKIVHFMTGVVLMASCLLAVFPKSLKSIMALLLAVLVLLSLDELSQMMTKTRELDFIDLVAGGSGATVLGVAFTFGLYLCRYVTRFRARRLQPTPSE